MSQRFVVELHVACSLSMESPEWGPSRTHETGSSKRSAPLDSSKQRTLTRQGAGTSMRAACVPALPVSSSTRYERPTNSTKYRPGEHGGADQRKRLRVPDTGIISMLQIENASRSAGPSRLK